MDVDTTIGSQKRPRVAAACVMCRLSRLACDGQQPCRRCINSNAGASCTYVEQKKRGRPSRRSKAVKPEAPRTIAPVPAPQPLTSSVPFNHGLVKPSVGYFAPHPISSISPSMQAVGVVPSINGGAALIPPNLVESQVVVELLSKEVQKAREELKAMQLQLKQVQDENQELRQRSGSGDAVGMSEAAKRQYILSHMRFLSEYDLSSPDVPFAVTDLENKPVAAVKVTLKLANPMTCIFVNQAFCSLVGYTMSELVGERAVTTMIQDYRGKIAMLSLALSSRGERITPPMKVSSLLIHKDGTLLRMGATVQFFRLTDGQMGWSVNSYDEMENVESMSALQRSYPRLYTRLMEFAERASVIGSVEEVTERRKDVIRACQREEWQELLSPLCNGSTNRVHAALTSQDGFYARPLPAHSRWASVLAAGSASSSSSSSSPAPTTPSSSPVLLSPPEHATTSRSPEQQAADRYAGFSFPPAPQHVQLPSAHLLHETTAAFASGQLPNAGTGAPPPPPLSPLYPVPDMSPLPSLSAFLDQPDLPSWLD